MHVYFLNIEIDSTVMLTKTVMIVSLHVGPKMLTMEVSFYVFLVCFFPFVVSFKP